MSYAEEAIALMQRPEFIAARATWIAYMTGLKRQLDAGHVPSQRAFTHASRLQKEVQKTTGLQAYKKTWKIICDRLVVDGL